MPIAARSELTRLMCAGGGFKVEEISDITCEYPGVSKAEFLPPFGVPLLEYGSPKLSQSIAIEQYIAGLCPKFSKLSPEQRATDTMHMYGIRCNCTLSRTAGTMERRMGCSIVGASKRT